MPAGVGYEKLKSKPKKEEKRSKEEMTQAVLGMLKKKPMPSKKEK